MLIPVALPPITGGGAGAAAPAPLSLSHSGGVCRC